MARQARKRQNRQRERVDMLGRLQDHWREMNEEAALSARPLREYAQLIPEPGFGPLDFERFPYQQDWYSPEVADAEEVVWLKSTQVGMCLVPWTRVLTADLRWVPIGDLREGDELVSVDEDAQQHGRRLRKAVVTAKWERRRPTRSLVFEDGRELVMTPEHRMLVQRGARAGSNLAWREASRLRVGQRIRSVVLPPFTEYDADVFEDGWMSGLLDGEGSMRKRAAGVEITITQHHGPVYDRAVAYLRAHGYAFTERHDHVGRIGLGRGADVLRLLSATRPARFDRREWWQGMKAPGTYGAGSERIISIEDDPHPQPVVDIETSTGTFIAEGFVSHNSAYAWRWAVRRCDQFGETVVYIFPTDTHVRDFGDERIEPAIEQSSYLKARILARYVRHKTLKRIGRGFLHLRGSNSKAGAQSVPATALVFDEYDYLDATNLPQIERRITGARQLGRRPRIRRLGTPTIEGDGISAAFEASDQREWVVTCSECEHEQVLTWEENVRWRSRRGGKVCRAGRDEYDDVKDVAEVWRECKRCRESIEADIPRGRWVAQRPGRKVIGFHATRLVVPVTDLAQIVVASRKTKPQEVEAFENNDLGRPYSAAEASLDMPTLLMACELGGPRLEGYAGPYATTMGLDVAGERDLTVRIDEQLPAENPQVPNPRRALWIGEVSSFNEVVDLIERFRVTICAVDANPERRMGKALRAHFAPGRVVLVDYALPVVKEPESIKVDVGEAGTPLEGVPLHAHVHRTEAIDAMMDSIRQLRNLPLRDPPPRWFDQMRSLKRKTEIDTKGRPRRVYVTTGNSGDDYAHADVMGLVATELWRMRGGANAMLPAERPLPDEEFGFERVRLAGDNPGIYQAGFGEGDVLR